MGYHQYKKCIQACLQCAAMCNHCVAVCLKENSEHKRDKCIQLSSECAVMCYAAAQMMSLGSKMAKQVWGICAEACSACAAECEKYIDSSHCMECAETCRICEECMSM
jgi:hypothetical protein